MNRCHGRSFSSNLAFPGGPELGGNDHNCIPPEKNRFRRGEPGSAPLPYLPDGKAVRLRVVGHSMTPDEVHSKDDLRAESVHHIELMVDVSVEDPNRDLEEPSHREHIAIH